MMKYVIDAQTAEDYTVQSDAPIMEGLPTISVIHKEDDTYIRENETGELIRTPHCFYNGEWINLLNKSREKLKLPPIVDRMSRNVEFTDNANKTVTIKDVETGRCFIHPDCLVDGSWESFVNTMKEQSDGVNVDETEHQISKPCDIGEA